MLRKKIKTTRNNILHKDKKNKNSVNEYSRNV